METHPSRSAHSTSSKLTAREPALLRRPRLTDLDAHVVAAWHRDLTHKGCRPCTIATYLSLVGTICTRGPRLNAATAVEPCLPRMIGARPPRCTSSPTLSTPLPCPW